MLPILFRLGPLTLYSFGLFAAVSFVTGTFTFWELVRKQSISIEQVFDGLLVSVMSGFIGARLLFVLLHLNLFWPHLFSVIDIFTRPGFIWWGALGGGTLGLVWYYRSQHIAVGNILDRAAVTVAISHAIGLIGAFLAGSAYGAKTTLVWGTMVVGLEGKRHPVQLFEALIELLLFLICLQIIHRSHKKGYVALLYIFVYALARVLIEFLRGDSVYWAGIRSQWVLSIIAIGICLLYWYKTPRRSTLAVVPPPMSTTEIRQS